MKIWLRRWQHPLTAFLYDLAVTPLAWYGAHWLRFNFEQIPPIYVYRATLLLPLVLLVHSVCYWSFGLYRGVWRFASMPDFVRIAQAVFAAGTSCWLSVALLAYAELLPPVPVPRSSFALTALLLLAFLGGGRFIYRWVKDHQLYVKRGHRVLVVGAGRAGEMLVRDLLRDPAADYLPVAFVDDDPAKRGRDIHGIRVAGDSRHVRNIADRFKADLIFIAMPSASGSQMRRLVAACEASGRPFRTLPNLQELLDGKAAIKLMREVALEDLLGRDPVSLDWEAIRSALTARSVLVSGGGGSIGSELCRQIARLGPRRLDIVDACEFNLYRIDMELRREWPSLDLQVHLLDVRDADGLNRLFGDLHPELVFHAAAYKHVPMLEAQPCAAVGNNVFGTMELARAADRYGAQVCVLISTDKAVNPTNVMGASKRLAEMFCQNFAARSSTRFITVRFGNVLGSAGSVVPLFREQIARGGPVTVTHPDMERYFMTIPEAAQLILQAAAVGQGGEIFVLDMGEPVQIRYLAEQMIRLSGQEPGRDIEIVYTGLRPGEKLYEELFHERERLRPTSHAKLLLAQARLVHWAAFLEALEVLRADCLAHRDAVVLTRMHELVPEFRQDGVAALTQENQAPPSQAAAS
ncbi:polysaccharide biosynthesis protein [Plasticicumulans acidivorans]|uniref:FlaA1/EpsC-like NDP-sugar epimerase n=1 Tax=Plasticicumulans acidivorans TaxID=886464 RepID=A0A317MVK7_9GAMM|nr:nucleoside-diphosphate sugar epimerase/dehydratase [Plasticicumulans acidivorans]PWV58581.1 FlaA1/EpsC-like NDP-sugar epimerase [Plasticicumulans acidivorans]